VLLSGFATLVSWGALAFAIAHVGFNLAVPTGVPPVDAIVGRYSTIPWWAGVALIPAAMFATARFLGSVYRMQDGEPAFVLSPRGLQFRPSVFDERVRVPWSAIRKVAGRRMKNHLAIALTIDDVDRHVPSGGALAGLRRFARLRRNTIVVGTPMARRAWKDLVARLQQQVAEHATEHAPPVPARHGAASSRARA
jgi:hypothetical protein